MRPSRRTFLRTLATGATAASALPILNRLTRVEEAFAHERVRFGAGGSLPPTAQLREGYMLGDDVLYMNHASIGTMPQVVHDARTEYAALCETNPWLYMWGGAWEEPREATRSSLSRLVGADPRDVAITHNTTEGFNLLAQGLPLGAGDEVLFTSLNHDGAAVCWNHMARRSGFSVRRVPFPVSRAAEMSAQDVLDFHIEQIRPETKVLVFPHIDNMVGIRHPLAALVRAAKERGVDFVAVDGAQTIGMIPLDLPASGVDFYSGSPHKWVQSPKGLGVLYVRPEVRDALEPMWVTWGQGRWRGTARVFEDYGTRNLPEVMALGDAAELQIDLDGGGKEARYREIHRALYDAVDSTPDLRWKSPRSYEDGGMLVAVEVAGRESPEVGTELMREAGVVLRTFGGELNTLRVAPNLTTSSEEVERFVGLLSAAAR